jgi:hypothetical protein
LLEENNRRFGEKWGLDASQGVRVKLDPWNGTGASATPLPTLSRSGERALNCAGAKAKTSLAIIARDEEPNLPSCLGSVRGLFDEIVVVDTGSTDRTREIAAEFGAKVFDPPSASVPPCGRATERADHFRERPRLNATNMS